MSARSRWAGGVPTNSGGTERPSNLVDALAERVAARLTSCLLTPVLATVRASGPIARLTASPAYR
jgi:hypothetical protein